MSQIKISSLSYTYPNGASRALHDVSLDISQGGFALVLGASGSGKSTLLRCLNGLVPHFSGGHIAGSIRVDGLDPVREGPSRMARVVGMVFQDPESQFVLDRVEDEVAFALENAAVPPAEMHARVDDVLQLLDIESLRQRSIGSLSGGEQQRVAIAAALVLQPRILVLDEPTSQLDPQAADDVMNALMRLNRQHGLTIVLAEHRVERVLPWVDQVIVVEAGRVMAGAPREALAHTDLVPPIVALGKALKLAVLPLSLDEARQAIQSMALPAYPHTTAHAPRSGEGMMARLAFTAVHAGYNGRAVLRDVNLTVGAGEVVALMGHNGAGKSTLLKCAVGLLKPASGDIRVNDVPVVGRDTWEVCRDVAYLPQNPNALLFADAVRDELNATLANHGLLGQKDVNAMLARLGLERYADAYPRDLSVGERERVAVGAVTVTEPGLLLLDEPTRGLDYAAKRALTDLLRGWKAEGAGILLVTHDVEFVAECVDRVVLMADGQIVADGPPAQVLADSPVFAPQIAQVFPGTGWLTVDDAVRHITGRMANE